MSVIFLDFDGVLHPNHCDPQHYFCRLPMLSEALAFAKVKIVISSSWRFHFSRDEILRRFPSEMRSLIVGFTCDAYIGQFSRYNEIKNYTERNGITDWLAIDDSRFEFPPNCYQLILCDGKIGISEKEAAVLGKRLCGTQSS